MDAFLSFVFLRLKGGLLPFALSVCLIISLFCGASLMYSYYKNLLWQKTEIKARLRLNAQSALQIMLAGGVQEIDYQRSQIFDLFGQGTDSVQVTKEYWGLYNLLKVKSFSNDFQYEERILTAYNSSAIPNAALYVPDQNKPLYMVGNSLIKGDVYTSKAGIKSGYIGKTGFNNPMFVEGKIHHSGSSIPNLNSDLPERLDYILSFPIHPSKNFNEDQKDVYNSFFNETIKFSEKDILVIKNNLKGNVIISSSKKILVPSNIHLENVILTAPFIEFENGFKGVLQAFATDTLLVGNDCNFYYPSSLFTLNKEKSYMAVGGDSSIEGCVAMLSTDTKNNGRLEIMEGSIVVGQIISNGEVEHKGTVLGQIICSKFAFTNLSGRYENYIVNGTVDQSKLPEPYLYAILFEQRDTRFSILDRLN